MKLIITDVDQTITSAGIDLWNEINLMMIPADKLDKYNAELLDYKQTVYLDPVKKSFKMMELAINLFNQKIEHSLLPIEVYTKTYEKVRQLLNNGGIRKNAVEFLTHNIKTGGEVVFSSANYIEGAVAVRDALFEENQEIKDKVLVSGSIVNWHEKSVLHINVAENKIMGVEKLLNKTRTQIISQKPMVFGDDPVINDIELFKLNKNESYLMETPKNIEMSIPEYIKRASWEDVFSQV